MRRLTIVSLDEWLTLTAREHPDRPAVIAGGRASTYRELDEAAARVARRLAAAGVGPGDRVATTLPPGHDFAELLHALPRRGAVLVPLNTRLSAAELRRQRDDAAVRMVVEEPLSGEEADVELRSEVGADEPHTLIFTSGTTSRAKPVILTCGNHHASAMASAANLGVEPGDRWLCVLPLFHVGGLAILLRSAIYGTTAVIHDGFDANHVRASLESSEITLVSLVATMLRRLRDAGLKEAPALRAALIGGGPVPRDLLEWGAGRGLPLLQTYGMTETASQVVTLPVAEALAGRAAAGRPLPGVELRTGDDGEVLVRGPMVSAGALGPDGWLHTGDRGTIDEDGYLHLEGRIKDTIVTGGENVAPAEVEEALLDPAVVDAAVAGRPDPEWGEAVTAFVVVSADVADEELLARARERLAGYKVPRAVHRIAAIPRNAAGKVDRARLPML